MEQTISKFPNPFGSVAPHKLFAWGLSATVGYGFAIWGVRIYQNQTVELGGQLLVVLMQAFVLPALLYGADRLRRRFPADATALFGGLLFAQIPRLAASAGSAWLYALVLLCPLLYLAIIVLMFVIIHSLRRSIREERTLDKRNVWYLRAIGMLTIVTELISDTVDWVMNSRAAELLAGSGYTVDAGFHVSYAMIIMGILILFAAEVFAIGQNLSEEQKLTI